MSYDLYFTKPKISREQFTVYFGRRRNYQVSDQQSVYQNEDTGVYFAFDYHDEKEVDEDAVEHTASLNLNFYRPHIFGLEAVDEVAAFVEHFGFSIHDPQGEGTGDGPFSKEAFLKGWNHGNEFAYSALLSGENRPTKIWTLPGERLEAIWRWNLEKASVQEALQEDRFVPRVFLMTMDGRVMSAAVWPDAIPELIPKVDILIIGRDELAPRRFFGGRKPDQILVPFERMESVLKPYAIGGHPLPAYNLPSPQVPDALRAGIREMKATGITGEGLAVDQVLNEEIVAKFRKS